MLPEKLNDAIDAIASAIRTRVDCHSGHPENLNRMFFECKALWRIPEFQEDDIDVELRSFSMGGSVDHKASSHMKLENLEAKSVFNQGVDVLADFFKEAPILNLNSVFPFIWFRAWGKEEADLRYSKGGCGGFFRFGNNDGINIFNPFDMGFSVMESLDAEISDFKKKLEILLAEDFDKTNPKWIFIKNEGDVPNGISRACSKTFLIQAKTADSAQRIFKILNDSKNTTAKSEKFMLFGPMQT